MSLVFVKEFNHNLRTAQVYRDLEQPRFIVEGYQLGQPMFKEILFREIDAIEYAAQWIQK